MFNFKSRLFLFCLLVACCLAAPEAFKSWKESNRKMYASEEEEAFRSQIFLSMVEKVERHNADPTQTHQIGLNQFSDLTTQEFAKTYLIAKPPDTALAAKVKFDRSLKRRNLQQVVSPVDWEALGKCTLPKNMYNCAASWIFAATGAIESMMLIVPPGTTWAMSEQQIMNCTVGGCGFGDIYSSFNYTAVLGVYNNTYFGFFGVDGVCKKAGGPYKISNFTSYDPGCDNLKIALQTRPVSVYVDSTSWMPYKSGILSSDPSGSCGAATGNYFATLVGYTDTYWKLRNSFGRYWGENGYIRIAQGNTCFICDKLFYMPVP